MNEMIAYCGLNCQTCEAYIATIRDDDQLREEVAKKWSEYNNVSISKEMINCMGCKSDGVKTPFCDSMCDIRICAIERNCSSCGRCEKLDACSHIRMIIENNPEACNRLIADKE